MHATFQEEPTHEVNTNRADVAVHIGVVLDEHKGKRIRGKCPQNRMIYGVLGCSEWWGIKTHSETEEEAGLAHRGIADQEKLEQVIAVEGQANRAKILVH
jgi:hypothetical protein